LRYYDADEHHMNNHVPVLLPLSGKAAAGGNMTGQTVYAITKEALKIAAAEVEKESPDEAQLIARAYPHKFRHTFATIMSQEGVSLKVINAILGHKSMETTAIYTHSAMLETFYAINNVGL